MISERSANRGSCAQSCRKDYVLTDSVDARRARSRLSHLGERPRRLRPSRRDRRRGHRLPQGRRAERRSPSTSRLLQNPIATSSIDSSRATRRRRREAKSQPLVQIFSRGFTGGMYGGREGRDYVTRTQPDNRGTMLGTVVGYERRRADRRRVVAAPGRRRTWLRSARARRRPDDRLQRHRGSHARHARRDATGDRDAHARRRRAGGSFARRTAQLLERARASYASLPPEIRAKKSRLDVRLFGAAGNAAQGGVRRRRRDGHRAQRDHALAREQAPARRSRRCAISSAGSATRRSCSARSTSPRSASGLFLPVSEQNHLRQQAVEQLMLRRDWAREAKLAERRARDRSARCPTCASTRSAPPTRPRSRARSRARRSIASTTPTPRRRRRDGDLLRSVPSTSGAAGRRAFARCSERLAERGVSLRLRTPTIVRPEDRNEHSEVARPRTADAERASRARRRVGARGTRRRRGLRGQRLQRAHRRRSLPPRRATHRRVGRADDRRAVAARRAVGRRRLRRVSLRPSRGNDDRALRAVGGVRSRADDLSRPLRAEAPERRAHRSDRLHVPGRHRLGVPQSSAAFAPDRRRRSSCRGSGAREFAAITWSFNVPGDDVTRDRRELSRRARRARRRRASRRRSGSSSRRTASTRAVISRARSNATEPRAMPMPSVRAVSSAA